VGDDVLTAVAEAITGHIRDEDLVGRMGGDEFAVLLAGAGLEEARDIAGRILLSVSDMAVEGPGKVSVSIGCACLDGNSPQDALDKADMALLAAKRQGRNQVLCA